MGLFSRRPPEYRGYVDRIDGGRVSGWVWDRVRPRRRLRVEIYAAATLVGSAPADMFRDDLLGGDIGDGRHAFSFDLPVGAFAPETIAVKVAGDAFWLLDGGSRAAIFDRLMNSAARGLPLLRPGLSQCSPGELDVQIAAELQQKWPPHGARAARSELVGSNTMWRSIVADRHGRLTDLLNRSDPRPLARYLVDLHKLPESEGLAQGDRAYRDFLAATPEGRRAAVAPFHDMLASLAQYLGVERAECAEQDYVGATVAADQERLASAIEAALGHAVAPLPVFDGLCGLAVGGRILHGRDIQALYAALRVIEASGKASPALCEIGAGFGAVAYYAWLRGVRRYTIVDLPTVCAMQYFYLRKAVPDMRVDFHHPADGANDADGVDLIFATDLSPDTRLRSDIVLNCDSFPEMGDQVCARYFALIRRWAPLLLSINQEANRAFAGEHNRQTVVGALLPAYGYVRRYRFRSWIRRGYVEELWSSPETGG